MECERSTSVSTFGPDIQSGTSLTGGRFLVQVTQTSYGENRSPNHQGSDEIKSDNVHKYLR